MKKVLVPFLLVGLIACGKHKAKDTEPTLLEKLEAKEVLYKDLFQKQYNDKQYVHGECDDLLFRCLAVFSGFDLDYSKHEDSEEPGKWYRSSDHSCYPTESGSSISRDMLIGLMYCAYAKNDAGAIKRTIDYAGDHNFVMGEGDLSRTFMTPSLYLQYRNLLDKLSLTEEDPLDIEIVTDYQAHLQVLRIYMDSLIFGEISDYSLYLLKGQAERQPNNALFQALYHKFTDGKQEVVDQLLGNTKWFPEGRLPTGKDRSTEYLYQRDEGSDWQPDPNSGETHSGLDFLFTRAVLKHK